jgi:hypothetical protein
MATKSSFLSKTMLFSAPQTLSQNATTAGGSVLGWSKMRRARHFATGLITTAPEEGVGFLGGSRRSGDCRDHRSMMANPAAHQALPVGKPSRGSQTAAQVCSSIESLAPRTLPSPIVTLIPPA